MENREIDPKMITKEMLSQAMNCETPEELVAIAKENGIEMSLDEAKTYLDRLENIDTNLSDEDMANIAGGAGSCYTDCPFY